LHFAKKIKIATILAILFINIALSVINNIEFHIGSQSEVELTNNQDYTPIKIIKDAGVIDPRYEVAGAIHDRTGKIFSNITASNLNCLINRYQPNLNEQPNLFLQDWNITYASMMFNNIKAINYTKDIETDISDFLFSSIHGPIYFYQKFSVEINQYVNNATIFMQDINNPTEYTDKNSWEIAITNCSNDDVGTPNQNETLGVLQKPHPIEYAAHWEVFDFKNSGIGPIYLDTSKTNWTIEEGSKKYWYALRIKIPPDDSHTGGGPKFLYFSPDGEDTNDKGEGDTFAINPNFFTDKYYTNYVVENKTFWGNHTHYNQGNLTSFRVMDEDRYYVDSNYSLDTNNAIAIDIKINVKELTGYGITFEDIADPIKREEMDWRSEHYRYLNSFNISFAVNLSSTENIDFAYLFIKKAGAGGYDPIENITHSNEDLTSILYTNSWNKLDIIRKYMNFTDDNSLSFRFYVSGDTVFNLTINQLTVETRELPILDTIVPHDPLIQDLNYASSVSIENGTTYLSANESIEALNTIDGNRYNVEANTDNISIEFKFSVLNNIDSSLFDVDDLEDWLFLQPNPIVPQIDIRITSNVSIQDKSNLNLSVLEVYKGNKNFTYFTEEQNRSTWIMLSDFNNSYAFNQETTNLTTIDPFRTWLFMQLINTTDGNSIRFRLRYVGNGTFQNFNVSINEFLLILYVQNAISSDITSKISFGLNSATLQPSDIKMQNFGINITDTGNQKGIWDGYISNGEPHQGFYTFNVTSIWPEVTFDVSGIYTIKKNQKFDWEYILGYSDSKILWNVHADVAYYTFYNNIEDSKSLQFNVPSDWLLMNIYNSSISPHSLSGGWYGTIQSNGLFKSVTVYNISTGSWKVGMNSSKSSLICGFNSTNNVFIDKFINVDVQTSDYYGGEIYFEVYDENSLIIFSDSNELNATALENSASYIWDVYSTTKLPGTYYLKTSWILYNQTHAFLALNTTEVIVSKYIANLELLNIDHFSGDNIIGDVISIKGRLTYNETGMPIDGEVIIAEIYDSSNNVFDSRSGFSVNEGLIQIEYTLPEGYNSISIKFIYNTSDTFYTETESIQNLEIIIISQAEFYLNTFLSFLPLIGIILAISLTTVVTMKYRKGKLKRIWSKEALVLDDLLKISHLMIIHKDIGVALYSKQISYQELDSDLISGFLHAISQFRSELTKDKERIEPIIGKSMEMDYYDSKIVITDGKNIRVALILDEAPSEQLKDSQLAFTNQFEVKYGSILKVDQFDGDISRFKETDELIETYFNTTLMYPLQLAGFKDVFKLKPLEKALIEVAEQILKEKKFFFISSLLSFGLAGRKESKDQIVSAILSLKNKGIIVPIDIQ